MSAYSGSQMLTVELENLDGGSTTYQIIHFPNRVRVTSLSFTLNFAAMGDSPELERQWGLAALSGHHTPTEGNPWSEWTTVLFGEEKPVLNTSTDWVASSTATPLAELFTTPNGGGIMKVEVDNGVFAPGDYLVLWIQNTGGDVEEIVWEDTKATITVGYEPTAKKTPYEMLQANPWLD